MTVLLCGGTGALGSAVASGLAERGVGFRALVRPGTDGSALQQLGAHLVVGDLTDPGSLPAAVDGVETVVTTATAIGRLLGGAKNLSIAGVDEKGNAALIDAERAGVSRFVFVSMADLGEEVAARAPSAMAKLRTERKLDASPLRQVIVRPTKFQEVWLSPQTGMDPAKRRAVIYGKGEVPEAQVATGDVAQVCVRMVTDADPPKVVEFGGPEALSVSQVVDIFERRFGAKFRRIKVPRQALALGSKALARAKPEVASVMGMVLHFDLHGSPADSRPLEQLGINPRSTGAYIAQLAAAG
jgi:NADH dehydrogenase